MSHMVMASGEADRLASERLPARDHDQLKLPQTSYAAKYKVPITP